jgi:uncharacterized protein YjiS (DUF1127 family)
MRIALDWSLNRPAWQILNRIAERWVAALAKRNRKLAIRRTRMILDGLPDSILRDIGIARGDIYAIAMETHGESSDGSDRSRWMKP